MTVPPQARQGLTLALNAAEKTLQVGIADKAGKVIHTAEEEAASQGVEKLAPMLEDALRVIAASPRDIARIACVAGPGSFTGLRLAAATAAGLARATGALQAKLDYLPLLAIDCLPALRSAGTSALLWVLTHARRGLVYAQAFIADESAMPGLRPVTGLDVISLLETDAATEILAGAATRQNAKSVLLAGSGAIANVDILHGTLQSVLPTVFSGISRPDPTTLVLAALPENGAVYAADDIAPVYVRPSDAESNLPQLARRLGLDPEEAVRALEALTTAKPE